MNKFHKILRILPVFPALFCVSCKQDTRTDYEAYKDILDECIADRDFHTQLYVFPKSIEGLEVTKLVYSHMSDLLNGSWLMYLAVKFDEDGFSKELSRLDNVKAEYDTGDIKPVIKYEDKSLYLTIMKNNRYEYALYNSDIYQIVYVSNQLFQWKDIPVQEEHILPNVTIPKELDDGENSYNMYYRYEGTTGWEVVD